MMENMKLCSTFRLNNFEKHLVSCFCCLVTFFPNLTFSKNYFSHSIRVSNNLDPGQDRSSVGPDLDPNCLQRLSAYMCLDARKSVLGGFANNKGADQTARIDQPAHPRSLICPFVIRFLESIISKFATSEISIF